MTQNAKILICCLALVVILPVLETSARAAAAPDVGLITNLSGEVTYWNKQEKRPPAKAIAFLKTRQGDIFKLPEGAALQLIYFAGGRQETWKGPVTVKVGEGEGRAADKRPHCPPEVKVISSKVAKRMKASPVVVARTKAQTSGISQGMGEQTREVGVIPTMAPRRVPALLPAPKPLTAAARADVAQAEGVYDRLKKNAKANDITPEIYLLSVYAEYGLYGKMVQVIDAGLAKKPGEAKLLELKAQVKSRL
jgi:hypothetical protein